MIIFVKGNLFDSHAQALVNTVNLDGFMGKGIAFQFKKLYPKNFENYTKACENGLINIGKLLAFEENDKLVINFPTKIKWRAKARIEYIEKGLMDLKNLIIKFNIQSIAIPPLGSGNGGLNWLDVKELIKSILSDLDSCDVYIFEPKETNQPTQKIKVTVNHLILLKLYQISFDVKMIEYLSALLDKLSKQNNFKFDEDIPINMNVYLKNQIDKTNDVVKSYDSNDFEDIFNQEYLKLQTETHEKKLQSLMKYIDILRGIFLVHQTFEDWEIVYNIINQYRDSSENIETSTSEKRVIKTLYNIGLLEMDLLGIKFSNNFVKSEEIEMI